MSDGCEYVAREVMAEEWERLLEQFSGHTVFHTLPWLRTIEAVHRANARLACVEDQHGRCVAIWPVFATRKGPLRILGSPVPGWCTAYMGPLFDPQCDIKAALSAFLGHKMFNRASYFSCKVLMDECNIDLKPFGFEEIEKLDTFCVDLTLPQAELWSNLKSECRTQIRKAQKLGLTIQHEQDASFIDEYWQMTVETFANYHIKPGFTKPFIEELWRELHPKGRVHAISAMHEGSRIGVLVLPIDRQTMYYWGGASFIRCRGMPANNLLHWEAIELAQRLGLRRYDMVSTVGRGGRFKNTFGPQVIHMATHWERTSSKLVRALKNKYQHFLQRRRFIKTETRMLPPVLAFAECIGNTNILAIL